VINPTRQILKYTSKPHCEKVQVEQVPDSTQMEKIKNTNTEVVYDYVASQIMDQK
jgi:hypothetical protein